MLAKYNKRVTTFVLLPPWSHTLPTKTDGPHVQVSGAGRGPRYDAHQLANDVHHDATDVGRSCVLVTLGGRTVMFDCGMHMGFNDERRFPDFSLVTSAAAGSSLDAHLDCGIVSHL